MRKPVIVLVLGISVLLVIGLVSVDGNEQPDKIGNQTLIEAPFNQVYTVLMVTRVIDGDTFEAWVHIAPRLAYFADIRVDGVDTPETDGPCKEQGDKVTEKVAQYLESGDVITIRHLGYSFNRWKCRVFVDGKDLAEWIIEKGLTKEKLCG